jgi:hypothetical protein
VVDATVDGADFVAWRQELGGGASVDSSSSTPEPRGIALAVVFALSLRAMRRRRSPP